MDKPISQATENKRPIGVKAAKKASHKPVVDDSRLSLLGSLMDKKERLSKMSLLESLIEKKEPLAEYEECLKKQLINELF